MNRERCREGIQVADPHVWDKSEDKEDKEKYLNFYICNFSP